MGKVKRFKQTNCKKFAGVVIIWKWWLKFKIKAECTKATSILCRLFCGGVYLVFIGICVASVYYFGGRLLNLIARLLKRNSRNYKKLGTTGNGSQIKPKIKWTWSINELSDIKLSHSLIILFRMKRFQVSA